jgi:transcriptional regulator with XRE-family HTH domain
MPNEEAIAGILSLLKRAIRSSGLSQKEVDRRIGVQPGYLSQVMIGRLDLKLKHLLKALDAIGVDPVSFFQIAFPADRQLQPSGGDLLRLLPVVNGSSPKPESEAQPVDGSLERLVARALAEELRLEPSLLR